MNKKDASRILYRVQGSIGFTAAARSVLALDFDPADAHGRILCHVKSNNAPMGPSQALTLTKGVVQWRGESELKATDLFGKDIPDARKARRNAQEFLRQMLVEGSALSDDVERAAVENGISERTLARAKAELGIKSAKTDDGRWKYVAPNKWPNNANRRS